MNKEFIPYEQALALKELGFDEPCIAYYEPNNKEVFVVGVLQRYNDPTLLRLKDFCVPTYSQAFRWFRENHSLFPYVEYFLEEKFDYVIVSKMYDKPIDYLDGKFETYEEAELACLNKLIEIVKEK
jgi:hypothetical protein